MSYLKPCPFCGDEKPMMRTSYDSDGSNCTWKYILCNACGAKTRGKWFTDSNDCPLFYEEARDQWNNRVIHGECENGSWEIVDKNLPPTITQTKPGELE